MKDENIEWRLSRKRNRYVENVATMNGAMLWEKINKIKKTETARNIIYVKRQSKVRRDAPK